MQNRPGRSPRITISDVSTAAKVSAATVSRVLNGTAKVDPMLVSRVHDAVRDLGYRPNAAAQGLARGEWGTIGVLVPDLANPYFPEVLKAVSAVARAHGRRMMVMESDEDPALEFELVEDLMRCCDGVLLASPRMPRAQLVELLGRDHPMVLLNRVVAGAGVPSISVDFTGGMTQVCGHLAQLGHRRAAYLSGPPASWGNDERVRAFEAARAFGLEVTVVECGGSTSQAGYDAVEAVLKSDATAVLAYNDLVALGAISRLRELGVGVPEELSVIGFDDISLERVAHSNLTTVSVPRDELGRRAGEMLERLLVDRGGGVGNVSNAAYDAEPLYLPMVLQARDTSGLPAVR